MYHQGADEQLIMSVTGHRSKDGLRIYKEISCEQQEKVSEMIQPAKRRKVEKNASACDESACGANSGNKFNFVNCAVTFHKE